MARTVTTFKWENLKKGTPMFWIFMFGLAEGSCAYFAGQELIKQYPVIMMLLPWFQLVIGQIKMFISNEVVDAVGEPKPDKVGVEAGEDGQLIVTKNDDIIN